MKLLIFKKDFFAVLSCSVSSFKEFVLCVCVKNASKLDNVKTRIIIISILIIRTRNNLILIPPSRARLVRHSSDKPVVDIPLARGLWLAVTWPGPVTRLWLPQTRTMMLGTGPSSPRSIKSSIEPSAGGETAPHPGNKDKSFEKKPEFGVGSVSSFYLAVSSCKISYDDRVWECLARTGNIRAENLSNVLLSGETEWTGMRRWGWVLWLGRVMAGCEKPLSGILSYWVMWGGGRGRENPL